MRYIGKPVIKLDAKAITSGKPVYTQDIAAGNYLTVKLLHCPHASAYIKSIDKSKAQALEGVECVLTYEDDTGRRFTNAGQSYPEPSPYDRLILDRKMRYAGDIAAIVAAKDEKTAQKALGLIKVDYELLEPVLDFEKAAEAPVIIHDEEDYKLNFEIGNERNKNICASGIFNHNNVDEIFPKCEIVTENTYYTQAQAHGMMETYRTLTDLDSSSRLIVVSSTQVPFHVRRILSRALDLPMSRIKVVKPRIGGGFGGKQTAVSEFYPALITLKTGKAALLVLDRYETFSATNSRHQMRIKVKIGADKEGNIKALEVNALSNTGAYGEHSSTTVGLVGSKSLPLYNRALASRFSWQVVYTNNLPGGALRGYGATQGAFAVQSAINELAAKLNIDPLKLQKQNLLKVGETLPAYENEKLSSSKLIECIDKGAQMIGWYDENKAETKKPHLKQGLGMAVCMQGSGISQVDVASVRLQLNDDGFYTLSIGATDMGTGCDTILAQMAAEILNCPLEQIIVPGVDTDNSPFDSGSYASASTYVTGNAVVKAANQLKAKIISAGCRHLGIKEEAAIFDGESLKDKSGEKGISLRDIAIKSIVGSEGEALLGEATFGSPVSPPPFVAGFARVSVDTQTGEVKVLDYAGVVDCGTIINSSLARVQAEGGLAQGIGMALTEDVYYNKKGKIATNSFMQYKIPNRLDTGKIRVDFVPSYEPSGPFGAKSIGEVVINTPPPAIAAAVYNAVGVQIRDLPITPLKILKALRERDS